MVQRTKAVNISAKRFEFGLPGLLQKDGLDETPFSLIIYKISNSENLTFIPYQRWPTLFWL
jgi:hypothetical protein